MSLQRTQIYLEADQIAALDGRAKALGVTRSDLIRDLVDQGLADLAHRQEEIVDRGRSEHQQFVLFVTIVGAAARAQVATFSALSRGMPRAPSWRVMAPWIGSRIKSETRAAMNDSMVRLSASACVGIAVAQRRCS